jgi:drug/metabolite transporter (DMT)-like permease
MDQTLIFLGLMLIGTFFLGFNDIQKKKYLIQGINEQVLLGLHLFLGGLILLPLVLIFGLPKIQAGFWPAAAGTIVLNIVSQAMFMRAFNLSEASMIAPLRLIIPPLVIITGFLFLNEVPSLTGIIGIFITMAGLWFLLSSKNPFSLAEIKKIKNEKGILLGLLGSILFAISFPLDKKAVITSSALFSSSLIFMAIGLITILINQLFDRGFGRRMMRIIKTQPVPLLSTALFLGVGAFLTNQAFNYSLAAYASSLKRLQALWTVVLSGKFLQEEGIKRKLLATIIMFLGILLSVLW